VPQTFASPLSVTLVQQVFHPAKTAAGRSFPPHRSKYALSTKSSFAAEFPSINSSLPDVQPDQVPILVHPATAALVCALLPGQYLNAASFLLKMSRSFYS